MKRLLSLPMQRRGGRYIEMRDNKNDCEKMSAEISIVAELMAKGSLIFSGVVGNDCCGMCSAGWVSIAAKMALLFSPSIEL